MTQDVKESLTAWIAVSPFFLGGFVFLRVADRFPPPPRWAIWALQCFYWLMMLIVGSRWIWRRWRLRRANGRTR